MVAQLSHTHTHKPLGAILREAGLISDYQIQVALQDQQYDSSLLFGEVLALRGWVAQETSDFFAMEFPKIKQEEKTRQKIGHYLKQAKLLTQEQVNSILEEQKHNLIRFGAVAVLKGYLKQQTLDFLSENLFKGYTHSSYVMTFDPQERQKTKKPNKVHNIHKETHIQHDETYIQSSKETYVQLEKEDLAMVDNNEVQWID